MQSHPTAGTLVFVNEAFSIKVFYEPHSYMIYVKVTRLDTGEGYNLHEILHAIAPEEESRSQCSGADDNKMEQCLGQLGELCQKHLEGIIAMDATTLKSVKISATEVRRKYTLEAEFGAIKHSANVAWERKDGQGHIGCT